MIKTETLLIGGGVLVAGFLAMKLLPKAAAAAGGLVTGNNPITQGATNASGAPTTAYQGQGVAGTLGATANAASGGVLASVGEWLGGLPGDVADWWNPANPGPTNPAPPSTSAALDRYQQGGNASTGSGSIDTFTDPMTGFGYQWGG